MFEYLLSSVGPRFTFLNTTRGVTIAENASIDELVFVLEARDPDGLPEPASVTFTLTTTSQSAFRLNGANLTVAEALDAETKNEYKLTFM